ncbi:hypothetical protein HAX54_000220 [Datura stramonium]|uniref:Uncharacterized protein n=1 Tax=Datura stramonium TaxID=4076 RepID=A0ABS8WS77_DATST|nr:hypothetical protein [Datura stramonium]
MDASKLSMSWTEAFYLDQGESQSNIALKTPKVRPPEPMPSPMDSAWRLPPGRATNASTSGDTSKEGIARKTSYANSVTTKPSHQISVP